MSLLTPIRLIVKDVGIYVLEDRKTVLRGFCVLEMTINGNIGARWFSFECDEPLCHNKKTFGFRVEFGGVLLSGELSRRIFELFADPLEGAFHTLYSGSIDEGEYGDDEGSDEGQEDDIFFGIKTLGEVLKTKHPATVESSKELDVEGEGLDVIYSILDLAEEEVRKTPASAPKACVAV